MHGVCRLPVCFLRRWLVVMMLNCWEFDGRPCILSSCSLNVCLAVLRGICRILGQDPYRLAMRRLGACVPITSSVILISRGHFQFFQYISICLREVKKKLIQLFLSLFVNCVLNNIKRPVAIVL